MIDTLAIFDVDGTLVDSQAIIVETMTRAFEKSDVQPPSAADVRKLIGLSLNRMIGTLAGDLPEETVGRIVADYRLGFASALDESDPSELFPGVEDGLKRLAKEGVSLGIATGKSKRGIDRLINGRRWGTMFSTVQCADFHPSKPHPSMVTQALTETATEPEMAVMIGDSIYDIEMAKAAGVRALGVGWGYHTPDALTESGAAAVAPTFEALVDLILDGWK